MTAYVLAAVLIAAVVVLVVRSYILAPVTEPRWTSDGAVALVDEFSDDDAAEVEATLRRVRHRLRKFCRLACKRWPHQACLHRLHQRWDGTLSEMRGAVARTHGKRRIFVCVRAPDGSIASDDAIFYALLHEAAHCAEPAYNGHDASFWRTFRLLLECAEALGLYTYAESPGTVCGLPLGKSVMRCVKDRSCDSQVFT